jgi:pimeloyl-ACP methyl ester carboxylesterase
MTKTVASWGNHEIAVNERRYIYYGRTYQPDPTATPVIFCHPHGGGHWSGHMPYAKLIDLDLAINMASICDELAEAGHPVLVADQGGTTTWSNPLAMASIDAGLTFLGTRTGCNTDRVILVGVSMGSLLALNWARANPEKVEAAALLLPIPNLEHVHDNAGSGIPAAIDAAYASYGGYAANLAAKNPSLYPEDYVGMNARMWVSTDDPIASLAEAIAFGAAADIPVFSLGAVGHDLPASFDPTDVVDFLEDT